MAGKKRGQAFVEGGVHQPVDAAFGNARQRRQRDGQKIELERQRLAVKIAAGENFVVENQRIVGGRVHLDRENAAGFRQRIQHRAVNLRNRAQRIGILHAAAAAVRFANLAAFEEAHQARRAHQLAGLRAGLVDARVEGPRRAALSVER